MRERKQALDETHKSNQKIQELSVEKAKVARVKTFATPSGSSNQLHASAKYEQLIDTLEERDHNIELLKNQQKQTNSKLEIVQTKLSQNIKVTNDYLQRFKLDVEREKAKRSTKILETASCMC